MYDFVCTSCGKHLTQNDVLFDLLDHVLIRDFEFKMLKLRLTEAELRSFLSETEDKRNVTGNQGVYLCHIPFQGWTKLMAGPNNLNQPAFADITLAQLKEYLALQAEYKSTVVKRAVDKSMYDDTEYAEAVGKAEEEYKRDLEAEKLERERKCQESYARFECLDFGDKGKRKTLQNELQQLYKGCEQETGDIIVNLELQHEKVVDDEGAVLTGLVSYDLNWERLHTSSNHRCCPNPRCGKKLFEGAGTAEQKTVVFVGSQKTGKTSAILAGSHYLLNAKHGGDQSDIWVGVAECPLTSVDDRTVNDRFKKELDGYYKNIPPEKTATGSNTEAEESGGQPAYSVTLKVCDRNKRQKFLSMMDVPGEICHDEKDQIDEARIRDYFNVMYTSDAYVICFEDKEARRERRRKEAEQKGMNPEDTEAYVAQELTGKRVCGWAEQIQRLRNNITGKPYVPMMLLFTKCQDLEQQEEEQGRVKENGYYMLRSEQSALRNYPFFNDVKHHISAAVELEGAFRASLRCSPYGEAVSEQPENSKEKHPNPKNVDKLMNWIVYATGLAPVPLQKFGLNNRTCYVRVPECRELLADEMYEGRRIKQEEIIKPFCKVNMWGQFTRKCFTKEDLRREIAEIAMTRVFLFENTDRGDRECAHSHDNKYKFCKALVDAHKRQDSKDRGRGKR